MIYIIMQILEWSDTRLRFKISETEDSVTTDLDLSDFTEYLLEIRFSDDSTIEIKWTVDSGTVYFDVYGEYTDWKGGSIKADLRGIKWVKKVRFNPSTIKGKVLSSVTVPNVLQNN